MVLSETDWKNALKAGENMMKEAELLEVQGETLIVRAEMELDKFKDDKDKRDKT